MAPNPPRSSLPTTPHTHARTPHFPSLAHTSHARTKHHVFHDRDRTAPRHQGRQLRRRPAQTTQQHGRQPPQSQEGGGPGQAPQHSAPGLYTRLCRRHGGAGILCEGGRAAAAGHCSRRARAGEGPGRSARRTGGGRERPAQGALSRERSSCGRGDRGRSDAHAGALLG